jgi:hypothetical protein
MVEKISNFGLVIIKFSEDILTTLLPKNITEITPQFLDIKFI